MPSTPIRPAADPAVAAVAAELVDLFGLRACWFEPFPFDAQLPRIEPGRIVLAPPEPGIAPWAIGAGVELPVRFGDLHLGRFVLALGRPTCGVALSPEGRARALELASEVAPVVARAIAEG